MDARELLAAHKEHAAAIESLLGRIPLSLALDRVVLAWERGGLLTPGWADGKLSRSWMNVAAHNAAVGVVACALSGQNPAITEAALVHDAFKRREWEILQEAKERGADLGKANRRAELASAEFLRDLGFDRETVQIASTTGDLGLEKIMAAEATLAGKIVFHADNCVSGDQIVGYTVRFDAMLPAFQPGGRYEYKNEEYRQKFGRTHREVWDSVAIPLEQELASRIGFRGNPSELYRLAILPVEPRCR